MKNNTTPNINLIVPIGTKVVLLNDLKVLNQDRTHQKGTLGKISGSPIDAFHSYKIEFADGSVGMANRKEFSIHKQFNNEQIGFGKFADVQTLSKYVIYRCIVGSKAFGLDDEKSDTDYRGIYLPPADMHWSMFGVPEQIEDKENEECYWEMQKFIVLALKANPNILECLYTPLVVKADGIALELLSMRSIFLSKLVYQTYNGYVMSQFKKIEQDLRNQGNIKNKHAMHLIRLLLQGIQILKTENLETNVSKHRDNLFDIKKGKMKWETTNNWRLQLHKEFEQAFISSKLPERPDYQKANQFLINTRRKMVA